MCCFCLGGLLGAELSGGYTAPFLMLLGLSLVSLVLNLVIRKP